MNLTRIRKQLEQAENRPIEGVGISRLGESLLDLRGFMVGPEETVYEGGVFIVQIKLSENYPMDAPVLRLMNKIYHPNIDQKGKISCCPAYCQSCNNRKWTPANTIMRTLFQIRSLLIVPNFDEALVLDIAKQFKEDRNKFQSTAREWVLKYA